MTEPEEQEGQEGTDSGTQGSIEGTEVYSKAEIQKLLEDQLKNNEAYKSMQRAMSKLDREGKQALAAKDAELAQLKAQASDVTESFEYIKKLVVEALPEDEKERVLGDLREQRIRKLEDANKELQKREAAPGLPPAQQDQIAAMQADYEEQLKAAIREAKESLEDTAKTVGIDPKDKALDYGGEDEPFSKRLKALNKSIDKILKGKDETDLAQVRGTRPAATRTEAPESYVFGDRDLLKEGSEEIWKKLQNQARPVGRRK